MRYWPMVPPVAFGAAIRFTGLRALETCCLAMGTPPDGAYPIHDEPDRRLSHDPDNVRDARSTGMPDVGRRTRDVGQRHDCPRRLDAGAACATGNHPHAGYRPRPWLNRYCHQRTYSVAQRSLMGMSSPNPAKDRAMLTI